MPTIRHTRLPLLASLALAAAALSPSLLAGQAPGGMNLEREDTLAQAHEGYLGALAPANLAKPRPKPPFDLTGTWFVNLRNGASFRFGPPYPEFQEPGKTALREAEEARAKGVPYRDAIGQCFPAGMPMIMTRVHPTSMIQMPTVIYMLFGFTNKMRFIYLDGRPHSDPDIVEYTYNGESIGRWEGNALVVHTKYLEPKEHYIDSGIPVSDQFEIIERITMEEPGMLRIDYTMTDPKMWKGEWKSTKRFIRKDYSDIPESNCLPNLNENLPGTTQGQQAIEQRSGR
ncbi:MAG TPA: hypothetical protein VNQ32_02555 [Steroidobacteraceae bacterium]|nr:hypothetical protein [Steroidobacteraceae bacterium]